MKKISLIHLFVIVLFACGSSQSWPPKPAAIHLGEESCAACRMIISEERYGAQLHERGKPVQLYDDYGCLLTRRSIGDSNRRVIYVRSFENGNWLAEHQAFYVVSKEILSPMAYGVAAFATRESAAEFARGLGDSEIYSISELIPAAETILGAGSHKKE